MKAKGFRQQYGPNLSHWSAWIRCNFFLKMKTIRTCKASTVRVTSTRCVPTEKRKIAPAFRFDFNAQPRNMRHFVVRSQYVAVALKARVLTERKYIFKII